MKTERLTLLVTPQEKRRIGAEAEKLGVSASEYVRKLVGLIDAQDIASIEEFAGLLPELNAMAERLEARHAEWTAELQVREKEWAYRRSPEYREAVRREVLSDETINWDAVRALFGFDRPDERAA